MPRPEPDTNEKLTFRTNYQDGQIAKLQVQLNELQLELAHTQLALLALADGAGDPINRRYRKLVNR